MWEVMVKAQNIVERLSPFYSAVPLVYAEWCRHGRREQVYVDRMNRFGANAPKVKRRSPAKTGNAYDTILAGGQIVTQREH